MTECLYAGLSSASSSIASPVRPYGWLSCPWRRSSWTALRWLSRFSLDDGERAHAVGFEKHGGFELIGRHRLVIERALLVGGAVHRAAVAVDREEVLARPDVLRAFEHHVLEQMREAGAAGALVPRADVVDDGDGEHRRDVILGDDQPQTVLELRVGELDRGQRDGGQRGGKGQRADGGEAGPRGAMTTGPEICYSSFENRLYARVYVSHGQRSRWGRRRRLRETRRGARGTCCRRRSGAQGSARRRPRGSCTTR